MAQDKKEAPSGIEGSTGKPDSSRRGAEAFARVKDWLETVAGRPNVVAAAIAVAFLGVGWLLLGADPTPSHTTAAVQDGGATILSVATLTANRANGFDVEESYAGRIVSRRASNLGFERSGLLVEITVDEGAAVRVGDRLARLDIQKLRAQKEERQAELAHRLATRKETAARLALAHVTVQRRVKLLKMNNVSRHNYDEAVFDEKALQSLLKANTAAIEQVVASLKSLDVDLQLSAIYAPFDGTIVERRVDEGTSVNAGEPVFRLIEDAVKEVRVGIPVQATGALRVGDIYDIEVAGERFDVRLRTLLAILDTDTRTVPAIFEVDDPDRHLRSGQLARLKLRYTVPAEGFWLPLTALIGGRRGLWNAYVLEPAGEKNGQMRVKRRELQMLHIEADRAFVRGTLRDGDQVVANGVHRLVPDQRVRLAR